MAFWNKSPDPKSKLREMIGDYELPCFSSAAVATLSLLRGDADMAEIARRLMSDPGLNVRILRTVNSPAFGLRRKVSNLEHAANLLGRSRIESLVLTAAVGDSLPSPGAIDTAGFWHTSAHRACIARGLARSLHPAQETEAFTAALLQDMAVPVLAEAFADRYPALYERSVNDDSASLHELEQEALGTDHAQVGAVMAESWDLPEALIAAIADHHLPEGRAPHSVAAVTRVRHSREHHSLEALRAHCTERLKVAADAVNQIIESAGSEAVSLAQSMGWGAPAAVAT